MRFRLNRSTEVAGTAGEGGHARRVSRRTWAIAALIGLVLGGLLLSLLARGASEETPAPVVSDSPAVPVAEEPSATAHPSYGVPVRLKIPRIGVDAPVVGVGVTPEGIMESPEGPEATGWYEPGVRPGDEGSAVIAGHSGYRTGPAVFDDLTELREGDRIYVLDDTGTSIAFQVAESRLYDPDARAAEVFTRAEGRHLNLITCTGVWDAAAGTHSNRLVVFADAIPPSSPGSSTHNLLPR